MRTATIGGFDRPYDTCIGRGPSRGRGLYVAGLALAYWVLVYEIEAAIERDRRRGASPDEIQRERRRLYRRRTRQINQRPRREHRRGRFPSSPHLRRSQN